MRRATTLLALLTAVLFSADAPARNLPPSKMGSPSTSPWTADCTDAIVDLIGCDRKSLDVQAYNLTSTDIAEAIKQAHERGVNVRVILN
jgi:phosphatidylserine/phosphatidylglycerophosphate/cardiolipin synthase-like enzyme